MCTMVLTMGVGVQPCMTILKKKSVCRLNPDRETLTFAPSLDIQQGHIHIQTSSCLNQHDPLEP